MAIELPDDLAVADGGRVERVEPAPVHARRAARRHGIEMPVDRLAEGQAAIAQQIEPSRERIVRGGDDPIALLRESGA